MNVLGIETSCDETATAVVSDGRRIRSSLVYSQLAAHRPYGGVVPEIASREHGERLPDLLSRALDDAGLSWDAIDALAVTRGPGLAGCLLVGVAAAGGLALRLGKPLYGIHHLKAHAYAVFLQEGAPAPEDACPLLTLLASGGHTSLIMMDAPGSFRLIGRTLDDAAGEALDKGACLMGLEYPGGPAIERAAVGGRADAVSFPLGLGRSGGLLPGGLDRRLCFSYSGVKTSLRNHLLKHPLSGDDRPERLADLAASYQQAVFAALLDRVERAIEQERPRTLAAGGGVLCNASLRRGLLALARSRGIPLLLPDAALCADNAAMIAGLAGHAAFRPAPAGATLDIAPSLPITEDA